MLDTFAFTDVDKMCSEYSEFRKILVLNNTRMTKHIIHIFVRNYIKYVVFLVLKDIAQFTILQVLSPFTILSFSA